MNPISALLVALAASDGGLRRWLGDGRHGGATGDVGRADRRRPTPVRRRRSRSASAPSPTSSTRSASARSRRRRRCSGSSRWCRTGSFPGTLNVGHTLPTVVQAFFYISVIPVDVVTLISMIAAAVAGAWLGAGIVARLVEAERADRDGLRAARRGDLLHDAEPRPVPRRRRTRSASRGVLLVVAVAGNFLLGALMSLGIGLYAPCMILVSLLGMSETHRVPDHDGLVRVPDAGRQPEVHRGSAPTACASRSAWRSAAFPA